MARQVKENTQGAPTEGLGQTITFAPKLAGAMPQATGVDFGQVRGGVKTVGGGTEVPAPMMLQAAPPNKTIALLSQVASEVTKADIEKMKVEKFVGGMQRAMQGAAVSEVAADQPWYSTLFGEGDAVEGARAWASSAKAASIATEMENRMEKLAEMPPYEAQAYFTQTVTDNLTGDRATDAAILQAMTRYLPSVMKTQSKAHIAYQQKRAVAADAGQFEANAGLLQTQLARPAYGEQDMLTHEANKDRFFYDQVPPVGVDAENWQDSKTKQMLNAIQRGEFHAINALMRPGKNLLVALKPEQALAVEKALETGQERARTRYRPEYATDITAIHMMAAHMPEGKTTRDLQTRIDTVNSRYQVETGSSIGIFSTNERTSLLVHGYNGIIREQEARQRKIDAADKVATTAADKAAVEAAKQDLIVQALSRGTVSQLVASKKISNEDIYPVANAEYLRMPTMPEKVGYLEGLFKDKFVVAPIADAKDGAVGMAIRDNVQNGFVGSLPALYAEWNTMHERDPVLASSYYPKYGPRMAAFKKELELGQPEMVAWKNSGEYKERNHVDKALMKEVTSAVAGTSTFLFRSILTDGAKDAVSKVAGPIAEVYAPTMGAKAAAELATKRVLSEGKAEVMGNHGWSRYHESQAPLAHFLTRVTTQHGATLPVDKVDDFVSSYFNDRIRAVGGEPSSSVVFRAPDIQGDDKTKSVPMFLIQVIKGGVPLTPIPVNAEEIRKHWHKPKQAQVPDPLGA